MGRHSLRSHHKSQRYQATVETSSYLLSPSMSLRRDQAKNELSSNCSPKSGTPKSAQPPASSHALTSWLHPGPTAALRAHTKDLASPSLGRTHACLWHGTRNETKSRKDTVL